MKVGVITREGVKAIRNLLDYRLKEVGDDLGMQIKVGNCTYTPTSFTFKLEGAVASKDGTFETKERRDFKANAGFIGLRADDLDATFEARGKKYKIDGYKPRASKYPIMATRIADGKQFKFMLSTVKRGLV